MRTAVAMIGVRRLSTVSRLAGRASTAGTKGFVARSRLTLHHRLELSQLYINPVIHGPPVPGTMNQEESDMCLAQALLRNKSNGLFVYNYGSAGAWAAGALRETLQAGKLNRSEIVAFAGLGKTPQPALDIPSRLEEARAMSGLEHLDVALVEFDDASFERDPLCLDAAIAALESACLAGQLSSYGLQVDVTPYCHHTPAPRLKNSLAMIPPILEDSLGRAGTNAPHADLVAYSISPTTALPASYPMLDPDEVDDLDELEASATAAARASRLKKKKENSEGVEGAGETSQGEGEGEGEEGEGEEVDDYTSHTQREGDRRYTRLARNPLLCRPGDGPGRRSGESEGLTVAELAALDSDAADAAAAAAAAAEAAASADAPVHSERTDGLPLVAGLLPPALERHLGAALDELCPELADTPLLQAKALRVVLSVGIDAVVVDAELSACLGNLGLGPEHMLPSSATDDVFGTFQLPRGLTL